MLPMPQPPGSAGKQPSSPPADVAPLPTPPRLASKTEQPKVVAPLPYADKAAPPRPAAVSVDDLSPHRRRLLKRVDGYVSVISDFGKHIVQPSHNQDSKLVLKNFLGREYGIQRTETSIGRMHNEAVETNDAADLTQSLLRVHLTDLLASTRQLRGVLDARRADSAAGAASPKRESKGADSVAAAEAKVATAPSPAAGASAASLSSSPSGSVAAAAAVEAETGPEPVVMRGLA